MKISKNKSNPVGLKKNQILLEVLDDTAGILKKYPKATKELLEISSRKDEEDREDTQMG